MSFIVLLGGNEFDFANPENSRFDVESLAESISNLCRFTGSVSQFYSVAQHSLAVSHLVPERFALQGLLHDAHEAIINDVSSPAKELLPDYRRLEDWVARFVRQRLGIPPVLDERVKLADLQALAIERRDLLPDNPRPWPCLDGIDIDIFPVIKPMNPRRAFRAFMERYEEVS